MGQPTPKDQSRGLSTNPVYRRVEHRGHARCPGFLGQILNPHKYQYHDIGLSGAIEAAYMHLQSTSDESPSLPHGGRPPGWNGVLPQAWFPGAHVNVGGGCEHDGLANEALGWLVEKAEDLGLAFDTRYLSYFKPCFNSDLSDSMTAFYRLFGNGTRQIGKHASDGEAIDQAALDRRGHPPCRYAPVDLTACGHVAGTFKLPVINTAGTARGEPCSGPSARHAERFSLMQA